MKNTILKQILNETKVKNVTLVAVSKTKPADAILEIYEQGHFIFGENKVQELVEKYELLPKNIEWHLIGHLQTNKVKYIAAFVRCIHSVDSLKLLAEINRQAAKYNRVIDCFLQMKIAKEDTKFGLSEEDAVALLEDESLKTFENVRITGVMGMATFTDEQEQVRQEFRKLKFIFENLKQKYFSEKPFFKEISMGMSDDYPIAIEEGSTMVRIGSLLFGSRK